MAERLGRPRSSRGAAGFSLMEMMLVLVLVAITAAASVPPFMSVLRDSRTEAAVNEVALSLRAARSKAVSQGNNFVWTFTAATNSYEAYDDDNSSGAWDAGETIYGPAAVNGGLTISASSVPISGVTFFPLGSASAGGTIDFADGRSGLIRITLESATGMVTVSNHRAAS